MQPLPYTATCNATPTLTPRCVVLLDGFYEWTEAAGGRKQPYHVSAAIPVPPQEQGEQQGQQGQQEQGKQLGRPDVKEEGGKAGAAPPATGSGYTCMYMAGLYDEYRGELDVHAVCLV